MNRCVVVRNTYIDDNEVKFSYGIALVEDNEGVRIVLKTISDITSDFSKAKLLVERCNRLKVSECHLYDIADDFLE